MDIFPQKCNKHAVQVYFLTPTAHVDSRILKAIAIENSKDVDAAAEIVLSEILPYLSKRTGAGSSSSRNRSPPGQANEAGMMKMILLPR
ncbi:hypothetical protein ERO13_D08G089166v2 [Gossypium hirsutum]|uniref:Uncharacterized protein n=3 Tax=Gossypium TaxID=3633 RepID=A0A5J5QBL0_GOSBA|nr:hypothetical protein ES319_D08G093900v1 [Gossypium barbadense]KAG4133313.1 hypothetical protein ERO13_D08G089166v2 [Gossypium hirsutum]TYG56884.1 hypothetical protein ES288_D08G099300v1 [Gossypium darwinii]TYH57553.1 hypothetical protein ES332_D08G097800v1 [Gossypium tomentosum]